MKWKAWGPEDLATAGAITGAVFLVWMRVRSRSRSKVECEYVLHGRKGSDLVFEQTTPGPFDPEFHQQIMHQALAQSVETGIKGAQWNIFYRCTANDATHTTYMADLNKWTS